MLLARQLWGNFIENILFLLMVFRHSLYEKSLKILNIKEKIVDLN